MNEIKLLENQVQIFWRKVFECLKWKKNKKILNLKRVDRIGRSKHQNLITHKEVPMDSKFLHY